jgi:hypothetical protein
LTPDDGRAAERGDGVRKKLPASNGETGVVGFAGAARGLRLRGGAAALNASGRVITAMPRRKRRHRSRAKARESQSARPGLYAR